MPAVETRPKLLAPKPLFSSHAGFYNLLRSLSERLPCEGDFCTFCPEVICCTGVTVGAFSQSVSIRPKRRVSTADKRMRQGLDTLLVGFEPTKVSRLKSDKCSSSFTTPKLFETVTQTEKKTIETPNRVCDVADVACI